MRAPLKELMENAEMLSASLHNSVSGLEKGVLSWSLGILTSYCLPVEAMWGLQVFGPLSPIFFLVFVCMFLCDAMCELFAAAD